VEVEVREKEMRGEAAFVVNGSAFGFLWGRANSPGSQPLERDPATPAVSGNTIDWPRLSPHRRRHTKICRHYLLH